MLGWWYERRRNDAVLAHGLHNSIKKRIAVATFVTGNGTGGAIASLWGAMRPHGCDNREQSVDLKALFEHFIGLTATYVFCQRIAQQRGAIIEFAF